MNKLEPVEKDIIQASVELDVNKGVDEIHKEQNNIENLRLENIESEEVIHHSLEIDQEGEPEQSDTTSQENSVLSESSGTDEELKQEEEIQNYRSMKLSAKSLRKKSKRIKILEELSRVNNSWHF